MAELQLLVDDVVMKSFPLNQATIMIGRAPDEDLGSTNGTYVNKAPVKRHQLQNFDYIRIAFTDFKLVADKGARLAKTTVILPDA